MIVKFNPGKHSFRNGASNACVYTKATVQAMPLFPQTRKPSAIPFGRLMVFCLLWLPPQALANKNVLGNDPFRTGYAIKNRWYYFLKSPIDISISYCYNRIRTLVL